ncbi:Plasma membrane t-SNARE, secretory vesicle fusion [Agyrium rufum]|nr:Plasma membrane t-SNARE, secretory vesicle fusion [Agyrium rufum]
MSNYGGGGGYGQSNPYTQETAGGNPYAQNANPYAQGGNPYAQQDYGRSNPYDQRGDEETHEMPAGNVPVDNRYGRGNDVELGALNGGGGYTQGQDSKAILNECREISRGIDSIGQNLERLQYMQQQALDDPDASQNTQTNRSLDALGTETMSLYRSFAARIKKLKQTPGAGDSMNAAQVGSVDRKLKEAIQRYQTVDAEFRKKLQAQMARQYKIVRPDASDAEVREACEDVTSTQVFSQALLQSDRRGQSQSALRAVQGRHEAIQKIERQVIELAQLFEDMNALVVQQDPVVQQINQQSEQVTDHVQQANVQLDGAVDKARAARRKKWWCLGITSTYIPLYKFGEAKLAVLIILIIVAVIVIVVEVVKK